MDRNYIKTILNGTNMIHTVSKNKTQYNTHIDEFIFFKIFIDSLKTIKIETSIHQNTETNLITIHLRKGTDTFRRVFDSRKLYDKLNEYNSSIPNIGFMESTLMLINIFIDILG